MVALEEILSGMRFRVIHGVLVGWLDGYFTLLRFAS